MSTHQPAGPDGPGLPETSNDGPLGVDHARFLAHDAHENAPLELTELGRALLAELRTSA